jgi:hypothetical protein
MFPVGVGWIGGVDFALEIRMTCVGEYDLNHHVYWNCI